MLKSLIFRPGRKGVQGKPDTNGGVYLNSLKRFTLSSWLTPTEQLAIAKIPLAQSATQPGRSPLIPLQGPADGFSEVFSLTGKQNVTFKGIGQITTTGADTNVVGTGTKFTSQLQVGDTISTTAGSATIATVPTDTLATTTANMAVGSLLDYFFLTNSAAAVQNQVFVEIHDQAWRRMLMNRAVPAYHVFGSNTKPLFVKESSLLEIDQTLILQFLNYNTSGRASFAPVAEFRKWQYEAMKYPEVYNYIHGLMERKQFVQCYWLTLDNGFLALGATGSATAAQIAFLTATGDITIFLFNLYAQAFLDSDGTDCSQNVTVELQDAKTMRMMQSTPMPLNCCAGTAQNPFRLSSPWIIEPQTQIKASFRNLGAACKVYLSFHGVAVYTGSSWHGSTLTNKNLIEEGNRMYEAMSTPQVRPASSRG